MTLGYTVLMYMYHTISYFITLDLRNESSYKTKMNKTLLSQGYTDVLVSVAIIICLTFQKIPPPYQNHGSCPPKANTVRPWYWPLTCRRQPPLRPTQVASLVVLMEYYRQPTEQNYSLICRCLETRTDFLTHNPSLCETMVKNPDKKVHMVVAGDQSTNL